LGKPWGTPPRITPTIKNHKGRGTIFAKPLAIRTRGLRSSPDITLALRTLPGNDKFTGIDSAYKDRIRAL
jgi:hypothetical protein